VAGYVLAAALAPVMTVALANLRGSVNLTSDMLTFLVGVIVVALVGGIIPALLEAIAGSLLLNYYFTPPIHQFTIADANNAWAIIVFVVVAILVSTVVDIAARRTKQAARASAESELLVTTAGSVLRGQQALPALLERVRESFGMRSVSLLECATGDCVEGSEPTRAASSAASRIRGPGKGWTAVATAGDEPVNSPDDADVEVPVTDTLSLALRGRALPADDRRVLGATRRPPWSSCGWPPKPKRPSRSPRPTGCAPRCSRRSATTCAARWRRPRPPSPACAHRRCTGPPPIGTNCWPRPTNRWTGWRVSSITCWT
jgi:two-component system sensor histidine kinase KdpD